MAKYIECEAVKKSISECCGDFTEKDAEYIIENVPENDVVEVVRCKECEYLVDLKCENPNYSDMKIHLNHYCSYGKRKV